MEQRKLPAQDEILCFDRSPRPHAKRQQADQIGEQTLNHAGNGDHAYIMPWLLGSYPGKITRIEFLRSTAGATIPRSFWAAAYYRQQRAKGCSHQAAVRGLAFKWIRILYRCWQTHTPYDESVYLNALKRRGSPLLTSMAETKST